MLPAAVNAPTPEQPAPPSAEQLLTLWRAQQAATGRGNTASDQAVRAFLTRWPDPRAWAAEPLPVRLNLSPSATSLVMMLMCRGWLQPGWDWLVRRKLSSFWREIVDTPLEADMTRFVDNAVTVGFTPTQARRAASQSVGRLLIQTGRSLDQLKVADLDALADACRQRQSETGKGWRHFDSALVCAHTVLFHLGIVETLPPPAREPETLDDRFAGCQADLAGLFVAYLERKTGTCRPTTVTSLATRLAHFGRFVTALDPNLVSFTGLDRRRHIEPYLSHVASAESVITGEPVTIADQDRRIRAVEHMLGEISEWGWNDAPTRRLIFRSDHPRLPRPLPRYIPVDADRRLTAELEQSAYRISADALLLARAVGLRIGELLDLELDCVHQIPGHGAWLKVPLGKLDTERMVPLDDETVALVDRITITRSGGRPMRHPRTRRPTQFLFTHHGRRLSQTAVRKELARSADIAGIGHVTPHQLRHTYATALVNAGVSLQALMALLGHVSAEMSLRYAHLFDSTVRAEYERALDLAKTRIGPIATPTGRTRIPLTNNSGCDHDDWRDGPAIKARLAGGHCLRAPAQGSCPYANICEYCPNFRTDTASLGILAAQRVDTAALAADAERRGWIDEADRHHRLLDRLDHLIAQTG
ncbi:MAG: tyrosine-type recombinase/integrase [Actinobacteria bacterium]|nr:tyrosine-type recombinase/integrase [Actinomycetota bacterium]